MAMVREQRAEFGVQPMCAGLGLARASYYRLQRSKSPLAIDRRHPRALSVNERDNVVEVLNSERFWDQAPGEVYATLLDEGRYLCSERTMYRILAANQQVRERRDQIRHPQYQAPELIASGPNEVWSWDITKLLGPARWTYFYLYVILDIFSRYVVGWMLAYRESAQLGKKLIEQTIERQNLDPRTLTVHADRGPAMKSQVLAFFLAGLGVTKTHSRPYVSNDNPYSESQFKTMKYRPEFPQRFGCYQDAHRFLTEFSPWYNHEHHHSGLGYLTPYDVHYGLAEKRREQRAVVLQEAYERNPQRFVRGLSKPALLPTAAWINQPKEIPPAESVQALNPSITGIEQKNGVHNCPITHATKSGRHMARGEIEMSEDRVV